VICRSCGNKELVPFMDLGYSPPSNAYLEKNALNKPEINYPLRVVHCSKCWLVQTEDYAAAEEMFNEDYAYFSSTSSSWLEHASNYVDMIIKKINLSKKSFVVEIASNDGYLLKNFVRNDIPCLGIEPTASTAKVAKESGIAVEEFFFGAETATVIAKSKKADLIIGNNVFAHVPDVLSFAAGMEMLLADEGTITLEFHHLLNLINLHQFDTIYHEHYSYYSLISIQSLLKRKGLRVYDVEQLNTHGGSLRIYACKKNASISTNSSSINAVIKAEKELNLDSLHGYKNFQTQVDQIKNNLLKFLIDVKEKGKLVAGYGAAAKGNTFLNYAGVKPDLLPFIVDNAPSKQGKFTPGGHIPIVNSEFLYAQKPDYILILPWNLAKEIADQNAQARNFNCKFVIAIPEIKIF
jgi:hypothetical protein